MPSARQLQILIVEDNNSDAYLIRKAIEGANLSVDFQIARDGQQAVQFIDALQNDPAKPCPDVVILDINLPKKGGGDVLKHMRSHSRCAQVHVIVVSTSDSERDRQIMQQLGADAYFPKPSEFDEFMKLGDLVKDVLARDVH